MPDCHPPAPNPFVAHHRLQAALLAADRIAPAHVANLFEADWHRRVRPNPVKMAAAMPYPHRRIILLAADRPAGLAVWAIAGIAGWPVSLALAMAERLRAQRLVRLQMGEDDENIDVMPTHAGRAVAQVLTNWGFTHA